MGVSAIVVPFSNPSAAGSETGKKFNFLAFVYDFLAPVTVMATTYALMVAGAAPIYTAFRMLPDYLSHWYVYVGLASPAVLAFGSVYTLLIVLFKRLLLGKAKPGTIPYGSWQNRAAGLFARMYMFWCQYIGMYLVGSEWQCIVLRLMGVRIGRNCRFFSIAGLSDFDFCKIGDRVTVHPGAAVQAHTFENRLLKRDFITIGNDVEINSNAVVLQDTLVRSRVVVHAATLILKGDTLDTNTRWRGNPAQLVDRNWRIDESDEDSDEEAMEEWE
jgi:carbonic anhydrase/acetyltransferase-like protein (isoleucine patch superfamily)